MSVLTIMVNVLTWMKDHYKIVTGAFLCVLTACSLTYGTIMHNKNKSLSESLEMAENHIEAYQGLQDSLQQANNVLQLRAEDFKNTKDPVINNIVKKLKDDNIKIKNVQTVATQNQSLIVSSLEPSKIVLYKDTIYNDSIIYNNQTKLYYTIGKDTIRTTLDVQNNQNLIIHTKRIYKNKKSFLKRLLTFDFKKVTKYLYNIDNSNDLIKTDSVRVIEIK